MQTRAKPVLNLLEDIVLQTASRFNAAAERPGMEDELTPFAQSKFNLEFKWSQGRVSFRRPPEGFRLLKVR